MCCVHIVSELTYCFSSFLWRWTSWQCGETHYLPNSYMQLTAPLSHTLKWPETVYNSIRRYKPFWLVIRENNIIKQFSSSFNDRCILFQNCSRSLSATLHMQYIRSYFPTAHSRLTVSLVNRLFTPNASKCMAFGHLVPFCLFFPCRTRRHPLYELKMPWRGF